MISPRSARHRFAFGLLVAGVFVAVRGVWFIAPSLAVSAEPAPAAYLRVWKTNLPAYADLRVNLMPSSGKHATPRELCKSGPGFVFASYAETPAGHYTIEVDADGKHGLAKAAADLAPGAFVTVIVREPETAGELPQLEVMDDGATQKSDTPGAVQITVRSFVVGLSDVSVSVGNSVKAQFPGSDNFLQVRGLKPDLYPVHTAGKDAAGKPFAWDMDADLRANHHQTLLIYPDAYGRIRPRLIEDGELPPAPFKEDGQR